MSVPTAHQLRFVAVSQNDSVVAPLLAGLADEYARRYGGTAEAIVGWLRRYPVLDFAAPNGGMKIGLLGRRPVTGGAFRRFDATTAELKRIWTDAAYRRRGYAAELLAELENDIASRGYRRVYLTTGDRQPEAEALYRATGYARLEEPLPGDGEVYPVAFVKELP